MAELNWDDLSPTKPGELNWDSLSVTPPAPPPRRGVAAEVGRQLVGGAVTRLPGMIGSAVEWFAPEGSTIEDLGRTAKEYWAEQEKGWTPDVEGRGFLSTALIQGAANLAPSVAGMGAAIMNPLAGAAVVSTLFGGSQAQSTYDKMRAAGATDKDATEAAYKAGLIEAFGETVADVTGAKLLSGSGQLLNSLTGKGLSGAIKTATNPAVASRFAKDWAANALIQSGTEFGQGYGEASVENDLLQKLGQPIDATAVDQGAEGAQAALGMSILLGPLGGYAHVRAGQKRAAIGKALTDPSAPLPIRLGAAQYVADDITPTVGKEAAQSWLQSFREGAIQDRDAKIDPQRVIMSAPTTDIAVDRAQAALEADLNAARQFTINTNREALRRQFEGIAERRSAVEDQADFNDLLKTEQTDLAYRRQALAEDMKRTQAFPAAQRQALEQQADAAPAVTRAMGFESQEPNAMQLAMQRAVEKQNVRATRQPAAEVAQEGAEGRRADAGRSPVGEVVSGRSEPAAAGPVDAPAAGTPPSSAETSPVPLDGQDAVGRYIRQDKDGRWKLFMPPPVGLRESVIAELDRRNAQLSQQGDQPNGIETAQAVQAEPQAPQAAEVVIPEPAPGQSAQGVPQGDGNVQEGQREGGRRQEVLTPAAAVAQAPAAVQPSSISPTEPTAAGEPPAVEVRQPRRRSAPAIDRLNLIDAIIARGGISRSIMGDVGADAKARYKPGLFTSNGTTDLGELAGYLFDEDQFHQISQSSDIGPERELQALISRAVSGERITNTPTMTREITEAERAKVKAEVSRLAQEYGIALRRGIAPRPSGEVEAEIETAIAQEIGIAGSTAANVRNAAVAIGIPEEEVSAIEDRIADEFDGDLSRDRMVKMWRKIAMELEDKINEREASSQENADAGTAAQNAPAEERPAFQLEGQSEAEARAELAQRDAAEAQRLKDEQAAEDKRKADAERDTFSLTGSDRPADVLAAQGQGGLFDAQPAAYSEPRKNQQPPAATETAVTAGAQQADKNNGVSWDGTPTYDENDLTDTQMRDGDVGAGNGKPYSSRAAAVGWIFRNQASGTHDVVQVGADSFVLRKKTVESKTDRAKDAKGNPIYRMGERVEYVSGQYEGRHGSISQVSPIRMVTVMLGTGARSEGETTYYYHVKTDNGSDFMASPEEIRFETVKPEKVVPDIDLDGMIQEPRRVFDGIAYAKRSAANSRAAAQRARKPQMISEHKRNAQTQDEKAARYQAAWDAWAKQYPEEAEKIAPKKPEPAPAVATGEAPAAGGAIDTPGILKAAGLNVLKTTTNNGTPVWNVSGNTKEHSEAIKAIGGRWYGPKKVWSFYNDDPSEELGKKLVGTVKPAAPPVLADNEVILPNIPMYIYGKIGDGWHYKAVGAKYAGYAGAIGGEMAMKLDAALKAKATIAGKPTIEMSDAALERLSESSVASPVAKEKAKVELEKRDKADKPDLGAMFDEVLADEVGKGQHDELDAEMRGYERKAEKARGGARFFVGDRVLADDGRANMKGSVIAMSGNTALVRLDGGGERYYQTNDMTIVQRGSIANAQNAEETAQSDEERFERAMRAAADKSKTRNNDVQTTALRDVPFDVALEIARDAVAAGVKPVPAQFHSRLDLTMDSALRLIDALGDEKPRTAGQAAASAVKNTAAGLADAIDGLGKLFGSNGSRLSSGISFDEETYAKAKPLFMQAIAHFKDAGADLKEAMRAVVRLVLDKFGPQVAENMKAYVVRFMEDVRDGKVVYDETKEKDNAESKNLPQRERPEARDGQADRSDGGTRQPDRGPLGGRVSEGDAQAREPGKADFGDQGAADAGRGGPGVRGEESVGWRDRESATAGDRPKRTATGLDADTPKTPSTEGVSVSGKADFQITEEDAIGEGGQKTKARNNIAAIRLLRKLEAEDRKATPQEQKTLAKYVGWGGIKGIFDDAKTDWTKERTELKSLLSDEEYASARRSMLAAHYTSTDVVSGMWSAAKHLGFKGGRVLEPSVGVGNFFGMMPADLRAKSQLFGVELDKITALLARNLYPSATVANGGFQDVELPAGSFDFVIGNPPFGKDTLFDKNHPDLRTFSIHNFFFAKALDKLRPGGVMQMVVSHHLMDAIDSTARDYLAARADLIGAIRLPDTAFRANAGTDVVTDIIFLQKREADAPRAGADWSGTANIATTHPKTGERFDFHINRYFIDHPEMVVGEHLPTGKMNQAPNQYNVQIKAGESLFSTLGKVVANLPRDVMKPATKPLAEIAAADAIVPDGTKVYGYYMAGGVVMQRLPDSLDKRQGQPVAFTNEMAPARADGMIGIRNALRDLMQSELSDAPASELDFKRAKLNKLYDAFQKKYGYINQPANRRAFRDDPDLPLLESLEPGFDAGLGKEAAAKRGEEARKPSAKKADIFSKRVLAPYQEVTSVTSAKDALVASLNERGQIDPDHMAAIYGKSWDEIRAELGDLIFHNPNGGWETSDAYLSGNVKAKLKLAKAAMETDPQYQANVEALRAVIPADVPALKISVRLGSSWVPPEVMAKFAEGLWGDTKAAIRYIKQVAKWSVMSDGGDSVARSSTWGVTYTTLSGRSSTFGADKILEHVANNRSIVIKENVGSSEQPVWKTNEPATEAIRAKAQEMASKFKEWIWQDEGRRTSLAAIYNEKYNTDRRRTYDGSHLTLPGSSPLIKLRKHQLAAIWRAIQDRVILLDHVVGAGKTYEKVAIAMELRRLGITRKPMFVVPNSLVRQWRDEFYKLYPNANVLAATEADFTKQNRKRFMAKIATGDWDAVIVAHSSFKKIGMPSETEWQILKEQLDDMSDAIEDLKRERGDKNIVRDMERIKIKLEERMKALRESGGKKDDTVTFDELGVDGVLVDEAHLFKNLFYYSQMRNVTGLGNPSGSGRAFDLFVKIQYLMQRYAGKALTAFATGTPVSNSLVEMFTMQRYLAWNKLKENDLHLLDAWAGVYGDVQQVYEVHPSGTGYRLSTRFAKFVNLPSLMELYRSFADVVTMDDLKDQAKADGGVFPVPKIKGGKPRNIVADRSEQQQRFFGVPEFGRTEDGGIKFKYPADLKVKQSDKDGKWYPWLPGGSKVGQEGFDTEAEAIAERDTLVRLPEVGWNSGSILHKFENLKELTKSSKGKINALSITNEARKAGLDYRLIDPMAPDFEGSKINLAIAEIKRIHKEWTKDRGAQLVFCDLSVPKSARAAAASKERTAYVRASDGSLVEVKATVVTIEGVDASFLAVKQTFRGVTGISIYDGVTGAETPVAGHTKTESVSALKALIERDGLGWLEDLQDRYGEITDADIADFKDAQGKEEEAGEEGDEGAISVGELLALAGGNRFSVYDDIKAKLLKSGIPESEVAFIHDYDTAAKKNDLFKKVRAGEIRILLGSTEKMGAGMNVQERLVALHHLDAPWRPSDLEQREGRIVRQGNSLYARDPDGFEVEILRYGTRQTYDTRMWQIIEHKAAGVEQLRKAGDDLLEIDDVGGEAANAADMKAAASGNPLILDEIKLRNEVKSLEAQQFAYIQAKANLQDKVRWYRGAPARAESYVAEIQPFIDAAKSNPVKPFAFVTNDGKTIEDIKETAGPLTETFVYVAKGQLGEQGAVGKYRGMTIKFRKTMSGISVYGEAGSVKPTVLTSYGIEDKFSPSGMFQRLDNTLDKIADAATAERQRAEREVGQIPKLEDEIAKPFAREEALKETRANYRAVVSKLQKSGGGIELTPDMKGELEQEIARRTGKKGMESRAGYTREAFSGDAIDEIRAVVDGFKAKFKGTAELDIRVVGSAAEIPARFRPSRYAEGVYHSDIGTIWLVTDNLMRGGRLNRERTLQVLMHEAIGHHGLSAMMGDKFSSVQTSVLKVARAKQPVGEDVYRPGDTDYATVEAVRLRYPDATDSEVAQEVLARAAETVDGLSRFGYAMATLRQWLREFARAMGIPLRMTDTEIRDIVQRAAGYMRAGRNLEDMAGEQAPSGVVAASKSVQKQYRAVDTESAAFKRLIRLLDPILSRNPTVLEGTVDRLSRDAEFLRNLFVSKSFILEGFGGLEIPAQREVIHRVLSLGKDRQVLDAIVELIPVDVMNVLGGQEISPKVLFHDEAMLKNLLSSINGNDSVTATHPAFTLVKAIATVATEIADRANLKGLGSARKRLSAVLADKIVSSQHINSNGDLDANSIAQIKSVSNTGEFSDSPSILESRAPAKSLGDLTADQEQALRNVGGITEPKTIGDRLRDVAKINFRQGLVDQFAPIKDLDQRAYMLSRMSKGADGTLESAMLFGKPYVDADGVMDVKIEPDGGFAKVLAGLKGEHDRFFWWIAAQRAEKIKRDHAKAEADHAVVKAAIQSMRGNPARYMVTFNGSDLQEFDTEGDAREFIGEESQKYGRDKKEFDIRRDEVEQYRARLDALTQLRDRLKAQMEVDERLFSGQDISALKTLSNGTMPDGSSRQAAFLKAQKALNEYNNAVLDVAQKSGLIDQDAVDMFRDQPYVPFYRVLDDDGKMPAGTMSSGMVNQRAWKKLTGGTERLNEDLLANVLMNWSHIYTAAARNRAAVATMKAAVDAGIAEQVPSGTKGSVTVKEGGKDVSYAIDDPYVLEAVSALEHVMPRWQRPLASFKRLMTFGVTVSPFFKVRNLIRDSVSAIGQSDLDWNIGKNLREGWEGTRKDGQTYASMLASGGIIRFGTQVEDNRAGHARRTIEKIEGHVLDQKGWLKLAHQARDVFDWYQEQGDRSENINRAALYKQLRDKGYSHADASFASRDLLDFSMSGRWPVVRFLAATVPFLNARLQGLYKLGRAGAENPKRMGAVLGAVSLASLALLLAYSDDDDWKNRPDWDKDTYWWFKIGDTAFRIPKPFEIGTVGTLVERLADAAFVSNEPTRWRDLRESLSRAIFQTFAFDPTPQAVKPVLDIYANLDPFRDAPIENMGMQKLRPADRSTERTSQLAIWLGQMGLPNPAALAKGQWDALSPVQIDYLIRGYTGWAGASVIGAADIVFMPATGKGARPNSDILATSTGKMIEQLGVQDSSRYVDAFYKQLKDIEEAHASYTAALKAGDIDEAKAILAGERDALVKYKASELANRRLGYLNRQLKRIEADVTLSGAEKRETIDKINRQKAAVAKQAVLR